MCTKYCSAHPASPAEGGDLVKCFGRGCGDGWRGRVTTAVHRRLAHLTGRLQAHLTTNAVTLTIYTLTIALKQDLEHICSSLVQVLMKDFDLMVLLSLFILSLSPCNKYIPIHTRSFTVGGNCCRQIHRKLTTNAATLTIYTLTVTLKQSQQAIYD